MKNTLAPFFLDTAHRTIVHNFRINRYVTEACISGMQDFFSTSQTSQFLSIVCISSRLQENDVHGLYK